ncbi:MAG: tyrosine-type recombinase/integrase [Syntrophus sp. (in: bacteria)]
MALLTFTVKYLDHAEKSHTPKVYSEKKSLCKRILSAWGITTIVDEITTEMAFDLLSSRATNNLFNKDRKNLKAMWQFGMDILDLKSNPLMKIKKRGHTPEKQYVPPTDHVLKIIAASSREEQVFLDAYLQTAARRSEILRWTWADDINFQRRQVRLGTRKTKDGSMKYDWMPMSDDLHESLWWLWNNRSEKTKKSKNKDKAAAYVFPSRTGLPYQERRYFLPKLCERAGVPPFGYHALRRYVASVLADTHKVSIKAIQRILRHSNLSTTERYIENMDTDMKATLNLLSKKEKTHFLTHDKNEGVSHDS